MASWREKAAAAAGMSLKDFLKTDSYKSLKSQRDTQENNDKYIKKLPKSLRNDPSFKSLTPEMQAMAAYSYKIQKENDENKIKALDKALEQATKDANPYWKNIIRIAQDETVRNYNAEKGDYADNEARLNRRIDEINQDLTNNKDFLSLEEQSDLSKLSASYTAQREGLINSSADTGMTFSTKRKVAESRLADYNQGIVESTKRQYGKRIQDLELEASRGNTQALADLSILKRKLGESLTAIGRKAETYLGSKGVEGIGLEGYNTLGNVTGDVYEEKAKDIENRKEAYYNELTQNSLSY